MPEGFVPETWMNIIVVMFAPAVHAFVLISGYFGIKLNVKKMAGLSIMTIFYGIIINSLYLYQGLIDFNIIEFARIFFPVLMPKLWFLQAYVLICILSPIIELGVAKLDNKIFIETVILLFVVHCVGRMMCFDINGGTNFLALLVAYLIGVAIRKFKNYPIFNLKPLWYLGIYLLISMLQVVILEIFRRYEIYKFNMNIVATNTPWVEMASICIFLFFIRIKPSYNKIVNNIAKYIFAAYVITELSGQLLYERQAAEIRQNFLMGYFYVLLFFIFCIIVEYIRCKIFKRIIVVIRNNSNKLVNFL